MSQLVRGANTIRTVIFPNTIRYARGGAFEENQCLRSAVLNEGLERLEECNDGGGQGIFSNTCIERATLPATLKVLGDRVFYKCRELTRVIFREESALEKIGSECFRGSGI